MSEVTLWENTKRMNQMIIHCFPFYDFQRLNGNSEYDKTVAYRTGPLVGTQIWQQWTIIGTTIFGLCKAISRNLFRMYVLLSFPSLFFLFSFSSPFFFQSLSPASKWPFNSRNLWSAVSFPSEGATIHVRRALNTP